jgi:hypothetical protein
MAVSGLETQRLQLLSELSCLQLEQAAASSAAQGSSARSPLIQVLLLTIIFYIINHQHWVCKLIFNIYLNISVLPFRNWPHPTKTIETLCCVWSYGYGLMFGNRQCNLLCCGDEKIATSIPCIRLLLTVLTFASYASLCPQWSYPCFLGSISENETISALSAGFISSLSHSRMCYEQAQYSSISRSTWQLFVCICFVWFSCLFCSLISCTVVIW